MMTDCTDIPGMQNNLCISDRVHDNACAYNMQGLLLERLKLYQQSVAAFQKALLLIEDKPDLNALCRTNYARVLG